MTNLNAINPASVVDEAKIENNDVVIGKAAIILRRFLHESGHNPQTRIEVEEAETAVDLVGRGLGDSVIPRGAAEQLIPQLAPHVGYVSLRPKQYDVMAIVHRRGAVLSPPPR